MPIPAIDQIMAAAIAERVFPGAVVLACRAGEPLHLAAYGDTMYGDPGSAPVAADTIYDIASLTKVFTATAALALWEGGGLSLDAPAARHLPGLRAREVTVRQLLSHSSGLELRLSALRERGAAGLRAAIAAAEPLRAPGSYAAYTNIGSAILGDVVAAAYGGPLDEAIAALVCRPLGLAQTGFRPPAELRPRIAPSEWDPDWRGGLVHGSVHDESAHALGGVAGHAGLFSIAADLARLLELWLQGGAWRGRQILREATVAEALRDQTSGMATPSGAPIRTGLGWMLDRPNFMGQAPPGSFGHTGFTGPAIVAVPAAGLALAVLCNRTYPHRRPPPYRHHAAVAAALGAALDAEG